MKRWSTATRLSISLTCATIGLLSIAHVLGLVPDDRKAAIKGRTNLCETLAIQFASTLQHNDVAALKPTANALVKRNADLLSVAVRRADGQVLFKTAQHAQLWKNARSRDSITTHVQLPIERNGAQWATVELRFRPLTSDHALGVLSLPIVRLTSFIGLLGFLMYRVYLRKVLVYLDPSAVIPERVKATLDTLAEGVLILDNKGRIVLANESFASACGQSDAELQGHSASQIPWHQTGSGDAAETHPWLQATRDGIAQRGVPLSLRTPLHEVRTFMVNSAPIIAGNGSTKGAIATFDDITAVEQQNVQLSQMLKKLEESRQRVKEKNEELTLLATRDPLTGCLNRRALFERLEAEWESANRYGHAVGCILADVDNFKSINDQHGHGVGDEVLAMVAEVLKMHSRSTDLVCRYGGEEFLVLLPHTEASNAEEAAEKLRREIESKSTAQVPLTVSLGVSALEFGAASQEALIDQADQALYAAKRSGRNRVVRWDRVSEVTELDSSGNARAEDGADFDCDHIPFDAVTALMSALSHRDVETEAHSRRVAALCVMTAENLLSPRDCILLETAALLHDIGKIGVPDSILLKPGPLTEAEWEIMSTHDRMGIEIINSAFGSAELTTIVRNHHAFFGGSARDPGLPTGLDIPLRARILSIADSYDAMVSDRVYRKGRSQEEATAELRRCAGTQFDPGLVEHFIEALLARDESRSVHPVSGMIERAFRLGVETERLSAALDAKDFGTLKAMTGHIVAVATKLDLPQIAGLAAELHESINSEHNLEKTLGAVTDLLDMCHSIQRQVLAAPTACAVG